MDKKSILITGINGFVGTNLYHSLNSKVTIYGLDITTDNSKQNCRIYTWRDFSILPEVDAIIHLAGLAHDTSNTTDVSKYNEINVGLTKRIFEYFLKSSANKFIFFSSVKAVADTVQGEYLTEESKPNPLTPYGVSKLKAENYLLSMSIPSDKQLYIFRPAMIHGPGNKGNLNLLYSVLKSGIPYPLGAYTNKRSFTSIQNLLFIVESFINADIKSGIYNICDDEALSTTEVAVLILRSLGKHESVLHIPKQIINILARLGALCHLPFNIERLKKLTETYVVSNKKIKKTLQVQNLPFSSRQGLLETLQDFGK